MANKRYSEEEIKVLKLSDCRKLLLDYVTELRQYDEILGDFKHDNDGDDETQGSVNVMRLFIAGMEEMKTMKTNMEKMNADYDEVKTLKKEHDTLKETVTLQQSMIETLDRKNRETHIVITGVKEDEVLEGADTDNDKCKKVLEIMGCQDSVTGIKSIQRLGKAENKRRPMLIVGSGIGWRDKVLEKSKELKNKGVAYKEIYVKKDVHPAVRREWWRLHNTKEEEQKRPENQGCTITIDYKRRVVLRDDVIIDKWSPSNFANRGPKD